LQKGSKVKIILRKGPGIAYPYQNSQMSMLGKSRPYTSEIKDPILEETHENDKTVQAHFKTPIKFRISEENERK